MRWDRSSFGSHSCYRLGSRGGIFCKPTFPFLGKINFRFGDLSRLYLELSWFSRGLLFRRRCRSMPEQTGSFRRCCRRRCSRCGSGRGRNRRCCDWCSRSFLPLLHMHFYQDWFGYRLLWCRDPDRAAFFILTGQLSIACSFVHVSGVVVDTFQGTAANRGFCEAACPRMQRSETLVQT